MVFIHGGAFTFGSASGFEYTPDYLINENVIVVTFNYRLNVFGKYNDVPIICIADVQYLFNYL